MVGDPDACMICGDDECPGSFDPMDCEFYWDVFGDDDDDPGDFDEDEGEWPDEDDYSREHDYDDNEPRGYIGVDEDGEMYEGFGYGEDLMSGSEQFGIDEGE